MRRSARTPARRRSARCCARLIRGEGDALTNGIIFCNRKVDVDVVAKSLKKHGFNAEAMHGDLDQSVRTRILTSFRDGQLKLLIASDVAARGLDIPNVSHIFNFDVPIHSEDYVHRIGRTGRAGRSGKSITLCLPHEEKYLAKIEELVKKPVPVMPSPLDGATFEAPAERGPERRERAPRRGGRSEARPAAPAPAVESPAPPPQAPAAPEPEPERRSERPPRDHGRQGRSERGGSDGPVRPGMGDHVPAFLMRDFRVDLGPDPDETPDQAARPDASDPAVIPVPAAEAAAVEAREAGAAKPRAPRRRRTTKPQSAGTDEAEAPPSAA